jgi:hypothetical protein
MMNAGSGFVKTRALFCSTALQRCMSLLIAIGVNTEIEIYEEIQGIMDASYICSIVSCMQIMNGDLGLTL